MNVNNYGFPIVFGTGYDLEAATDLILTFTKPSGVTFTRDFNSTPNPTYVGQVGIETTAGFFPAFTYAGYLLAPGDIDEPGQWSARLTYENSVAPELLTSDIVQTAEWTVDP